MHGNCKCFHHVCAKILVVLAWLSALAFLWASWKTTLVWNLDSSEWFYHVVVFALLAFSTKFCGCCMKMMGSKMMHGGMSCPACEGKGGEHTHGDRQHM